jgi:hypothetical protein
MENTAIFPAFGEPATETPRFTHHSGAFQVRRSGPSELDALPDVHDAPLERGDEYLPIYAAVESAWFRRPDPGEVAGSAASPPVPGAPSTASHVTSAIPGPATTRSSTTGSPTTGPAPSGDAPPPAKPAAPVPTGAMASGEPRDRRAGGMWESRADSGFQAAAAAKDPALGGVTPAGLPKRTPKANLVPGSVSAAAPTAVSRPPISADQVRNRLSSFQQGVRRGRAEAAGHAAEGSGNEEESS